MYSNPRRAACGRVPGTYRRRKAEEWATFPPALLTVAVTANRWRLLVYASVDRPLESELNTHEERKRPTRALVIDVVETSAAEVIDLGHPAHVTKTELPEETHAVARLGEHADVDSRGERRCLVVKVGGLAHKVGAGRDERHVRLVDEPDANRALAVRA